MKWLVPMNMLLILGDFALGDFMMFGDVAALFIPLTLLTLPMLLLVLLLLLLGSDTPPSLPLFFLFGEFKATTMKEQEGR